VPDEAEGVPCKVREDAPAPPVTAFVEKSAFQTEDVLKGRHGG
jgi:hypothetical protein